MPAIDVPADYGYVLIAAAVLAFEGLVLGSSVMGLRKAYFGPEFQAKNKALLDEHKKAFPNAPFALGYPDMGNGRYADKLTYEQWFNFNNAQRGHANFLESAWAVQPLLLVGGLFAPRAYASLGAVYIVARYLYSKGYASARGPKGRELGAISGALALLGMVGKTIHIGVGLIKGAK